MKRLFVLFLILVVGFGLVACSRQETVNYKDLFKIAKTKISVPLELDNLTKGIRSSFERQDYQEAYGQAKKYMSLSSANEFYSNKENLSIFLNVYMLSGRHVDFLSLIENIVSKYPTDESLQFFVLHSLFLSPSKLVVDTFLASPLYNKDEKAFILAWKDWDMEESILDQIMSLSSCPEISSNKVCSLIGRSQKIINEGKKYQDEPLEYTYTKLAHLYLSAGYVGLAYRVASGVPLTSEYRDGLLVRGLAESSVGLYEEAKKSLAGAYSIDPGFRDTLVFYAQTLYMTESWDKLIEIGTLLLGLEVYTVQVRDYMVEAYLRLKNFDELEEFLGRQLKDYSSEFSKDCFLTLLFVSEEDEFMEFQDYWARFLNEAEVALWYRAVKGDINPYFFEKNFGDEKNIPDLTLFAWAKVLLDSGDDEEAFGLFSKLANDGSSKIRKIFVDYLQDGVLPL